MCGDCRLSINELTNVITYSKSKALYHEEKIKLLKKGKMIIPTEIQVDPEAWCNDNCSFCSYRKEDGYINEMTKLLGSKAGSTENMPIGKPSLESRIPDKILLDIPYQMVDAGIKACEVTGGGEPLMHPKIYDFMKGLADCDRDIGLVTNGSRLDDKIISLMKESGTWIRISMDSSNPETHRKIHRTPNYDFEKRIGNIEKIARNKPDSLELGISFIITPDNFDDIEKSARLYESFDVNHIRFSWMFDKEGHAGLTEKQIAHCGELIPRLQKELDRKTFKIFNEKGRISKYTQTNKFDKCHFQKFVIAIGADSKCYPCCIMKYHPDFAYGNLKENTLDQIVTSMNTEAFMNNLNPIKCRPCWLDDRNGSIDAAIKDPNYTPIPKPRHENFI
jgi:radical SAM protein with 4Fe4S-binding SPASM domain